MKKSQRTIIIVMAISVFMLSFLMGRATALKDKQQRTKKLEIYSGTVDIPKEQEIAAPAATTAPKVEKNNNVSEVKKTETTQKAPEEPPERMLYPAGNTVVKGYSETAVYSKTMDDWRAHTGIDYAAEIGSRVVSAWDGSVDKVYKDKLWGYCVEIIHTGDIRGVYKNLQKKILVKEGQKVDKGQAIGQVGKSAVVEKMDAPHLHFELWTQGVSINPESYIY